MSDIRKTILDVLFYPIPGLGWIPGVGHITGEHKLRRLQREAKQARHSHNDKIQTEINNINIDLVLMRAADVQDQQDRDIQVRLFGGPLFNKETDQFNMIAVPPALAPVEAEFTPLENFKRNIRINLRPAMEAQIEAILEEAKQSDSKNKLSPKLETMFHDLQKARLNMVMERKNLVAQRQRAYSLVEAYLRHQGTVKASPQDAEAVGDAGTEPAESAKPQALLDQIELARMSEREIDDRIDAQLEKLATLITDGKELEQKISAELNAQRNKMRKRAKIGVTLILGTALAAGGLREGAAEYRRTRPYGDYVEQYERIEIDPEAQAVPVFTRPYRNYFSDDKRLEVKAHSVETDVKPAHGVKTTQIMDIAYKAATGDPGASADLGRVVLHPRTNRSSALPLWKQSYFVEHRLQDAERMLAATGEHHVFNHSITSDYAYAPGSRAARKERELMLSVTCPIAIPSGNEVSEDDTVDHHSQHIGDLSHYPRYSIQVGFAGAMKGGPAKNNKTDLYLIEGNHPYPFGVFTIPKMGARDDGSIGSSDTAPAFGGNIAAQKSIFPQLDWDNIVYASALGSRKDFKDQDAGRFTVKTPHTDLSMSENAGFGMIDPQEVELILHNMLYQWTLHPEIRHNPQVIVHDVADSGRAGREHTIRLPSDKDVFKITYDIVTPEKTRDAFITVTDEYHNSRKIRLADNQPLNRFTDWSLLGTPGSTITITSNIPIRVGYVAHINNRGAITLGVDHLDQLKPIDELRKRIDRDKLKSLPVAMPVAPTPYQEPGQKVSMRGQDPRKGISWHDDTGRTYAQRLHKRGQELEARGNSRKC